MTLKLDYEIYSIRPEFSIMNIHFLFTRFIAILPYCEYDHVLENDSQHLFMFSFGVIFRIVIFWSYQCKRYRDIIISFS